MRISFVKLAAGSLAFFLTCGLVVAQEAAAVSDTPPAAAATTSDNNGASTTTDTPAVQPESAPDNEAPAQPANGSATKAADNTAPITPATDPSAAAPAITAPVVPPAPPVATFENGQLTVIGNNGTLSDVLSAIQKETGAVIESAAGMNTEQVIGQFGPASPATVIAQLLNGTALNYVLVGSSDGQQLAKVLLSIRPAHVEMQVAEEGGSRHHRRGLEAMALEPQDQPQPEIVQGNAATTPLRRHHRRNGVAGASDAQTDSTDASASDTTAANNGDPSNLNNDPNATAAMTGVGGSAPGSPILPPDAPSNIMKGIQHGNGPGASPSPSARNNGNNGFGPTPTGLGGGSGALANSGGSTYTLPNGATVLGPGIPLPNGAIFFPGGARMPGH